MERIIAGDINTAFEELRGEDLSRRATAAEALGILCSLHKIGEAPAGFSDRIEDHADEILGALSHEDDSVQRVAVRMLGFLDTEQALLILRDHLDDDDPAFRKAATRGLCHVDNPTVVPLLVERLEDRDKAVRKSAVNNLRDITEQYPERIAIAVEPLCDCLEEETLRTNAMEALVRIGDSRALKPMLRLVDEDGSSVFRYIGRLGPVATEPLLERFYDASGSRQYRLARALADTGDPSAFSPLVRTMDKHPTQRFATILGRVDDPRAVDVLIAELKNGRDRWRGDGDTELSPQYASSLKRLWQDGLPSGFARLGARAAPPLRAVIRNESVDPAVRQKAIESLGRTGDQESFRYLLELLDSDDAAIRSAVLRGVAGLKDERLAPVIERFTVADPSEDVRDAAESASSMLETIRVT